MSNKEQNKCQSKDPCNSTITIPPNTPVAALCYSPSETLDLFFYFTYNDIRCLENAEIDSFICPNTARLSDSALHSACPARSGDCGSLSVPPIPRAAQGSCRSSTAPLLRAEAAPRLCWEPLRQRTRRQRAGRRWSKRNSDG